jgi:hypothetical protein
MIHVFNLLWSSAIGAFVGAVVTFLIERRRNRRTERHIARILNDSYNYSLEQLNTRVAEKEEEIKQLKEKLKNTLI